MISRILRVLALFLLGYPLWPQTVTVAETLVDNNNSNLQGYLVVSNPAFLYPYGSELTVSAASNASPIQVDFTGAHSLTTGQTIYITGVLGNTATNGTWVVTTVDTDSITLNGSTGNGTYTSGGTGQRYVPVGPRNYRYPTSGTFNGSISLTLIPTTTATTTPGGQATGITYLVQYFLNDGTFFSERWDIPATPTTTTISAVKVASNISSTSLITLDQLAQTSASGTRNDVVCWDGSQWNKCTLNITINPQTGTSYTVLDTDRNKLVTLSNASAIAVTLPQAGASSSFVSGWYAWFTNINSGVVTITPTTSTINSSSTFTLRQGQSVLIVSDGTNYNTGSDYWREELVEIPLAKCQNVTAVLVPSTFTANIPTATCVTGTNTTYGVLDFPDADNDYQIQDFLRLPHNFVGTLDADFVWRTAGTTGNVVWQLQTICVANAETGDPAFNTASTVTDAALGTTLQWNTATITGVTITGCAADETLLLRIVRNRTHASDTIGAFSVQLISLRLKLRRGR